MKKLVVANWKMNPQSAAEAVFLARAVEAGYRRMRRRKSEIVICPPFVFLPEVGRVLSAVKLGAQDLAETDSGPYTGEVSASQLKSLKVVCAIIGHSERRNLGESDQTINKKLKKALGYRIHPIFCVGHGTKKNFSQAKVKSIINRQVRLGLQGVKFSKGGLTIAYEPVWALSGGLGKAKPVSVGHAVSIISWIKALVPQVRVIYGGSVTAQNARSFAQAKTEGALVGGGSLAPAEFLKIASEYSF